MNGLSRYAEDVLVLDQQHGLGPAPRLRRRRPQDELLRRLFHPWQVDLERGAFAELAVHPDVAAGLPHDPVDHRETEARALAHLLGGEERLEDHHLLQLPGVGPHRAQALAGDRVQLDVFAGQGAQQFVQVGHERVQVHDALLEHLPYGP